MSTQKTLHPIQPLDMAAERAELGSALDDAVLGVLHSGQYVLGPEVQRFEQDFAASQGVEHGIGVASGTDALVLALRTLGVQPGDGVVTSPFTFFASAGAIAWVGARPVFCDVDPETALIDPESARAALTAGVKGLLPVHLYGQLVDMAGFRSLADEKGLFLLEDAAQAHGAVRQGTRAGELGDVAAFSFYPTKNLGCAGDGGALVTSSADVAGRLRQMRDHGSPSKYTHTSIGTNSRLAAIQAAVLNVKLPHLARWTARRQAIAGAYDAAFAGSPKLAPLLCAQTSAPVYHQYTLRVLSGDRDGLLAHLTQANIRAAVHYPLPVHLQPVAKEWGLSKGDFPHAEALALQVICLPVHPFLSDADVQRVAAAVLEWAS
ncbi:MAG: dTDP-4-amino-4,6-dideoxygalactose transaminase [Chlamydiales bacterium]